MSVELAVKCVNEETHMLLNLKLAFLSVLITIFQYLVAFSITLWLLFNAFKPLF